MDRRDGPWTVVDDAPRIVKIRRSLHADADYEGYSVWVLVGNTSPRTFVCECEDDSMGSALIAPGDQVLYDGSRRDPVDGEIVLVRHDDEFHPRIFRDCGDHVEARPTEPDYPTFSAPTRDELPIFGTYVGLVRVVGNSAIAV